MTADELLDVLARLFSSRHWPKPLHLLEGVQLLRQGMSPREAAQSVGTSAHLLVRAKEAVCPVQHVLGISPLEIDTSHRQRAGQMIGQLLLGRCAEMAFESIYRAELHTEEFELRDVREGRSDTDYRILNGRGRPVYRINIKFHGSLFRQAKDVVGLDPDDCFALATYKIHAALQKQHHDGLPYFFAIVGVPDLTGGNVGSSIPSLLVETVALIDQSPKGRAKREFEDAVVEHLVQTDEPVFRETFPRIAEAQWYVLSARRADRLLRSLLFERVFALRVRNFARAYRGAEVDMHFSLSKDLAPLRRFLTTLREDGPQKVTTLLERGDY
jgi:hypothetical protein